MQSNIADGTVSKEATRNAALKQCEFVPLTARFVVSFTGTVSFINLGRRHAAQPTHGLCVFGLHATVEGLVQVLAGRQGSCDDLLSRWREEVIQYEGHHHQHGRPEQDDDRRIHRPTVSPCSLQAGSKSSVLDVLKHGLLCFSLDPDGQSLAPGIRLLKSCIPLVDLTCREIESLSANFASKYLRRVNPLVEARFMDQSHGSAASAQVRPQRFTLFFFALKADSANSLIVLFVVL